MKWGYLFLAGRRVNPLRTFSHWQINSARLGKGKRMGEWEFSSLIALLWFRSAGSTISVSLLFAGLNVWPFHATLHTFCGTFRSSLSFPLKWAKGFSSIYFSMGCNCQISLTSICLQVVHTHLFSTRCCCCCCVAVVRHRLCSCIINARRLWPAGLTLPPVGHKLNCK